MIIEVSISGTDRKMLCDDNIYTKFCIETGFAALYIANTGKGYVRYKFNRKEHPFHHYVIGEPPSGFETSHKDADGFNNTVENLEHVTQSKNRKKFK